MWRRVALACAFALLLHLVFFFGVAPYLRLHNTPFSRTEVIQISPHDLVKLKEKILANKTLPPLLKQELQEKYKTKDLPKDAQFMGAFNQIVPEQTIAGPQTDVPEEGSVSSGGAQKENVSQNKLKLSKLGLGEAVPRPLGPSARPYEGPTGPQELTHGRPVGRDDPRLKRGQQNLLNAIESKYYSFFARFEEPIVRNWFFLIRSYEGRIRQEMSERKIHSGVELPLTLEFVIDRKGDFKSISLIQSSRIPTLDWVTLEAVRKLRALPNPPPELFEGGQYFSYRLQFAVHVSDTPLMSTNPALSWY